MSPGEMLGRALMTVLVTGCVPAAQDAPPAPTPALKLPADAAVDAPPDARVLARPNTAPCRTYQHAAAAELAGGAYRFHGVIPWIGLDTPVTSSCCVLPNRAVLCHVTEKIWNYVESPSGTISAPLYLTHVRLFDEHGMQPWHDAVVEAFEPGPMHDASKARPPIFQAHVENDEAAFWIVGDRDRVCEPDRKIPCDAFLIETRACGAYRKRLAPLVKTFCDSRGPRAWDGDRLAPR